MKVFLIAAISADGFIAHSPTEPAHWTSKEDKKLFVRLTKEAGYMVMGSRTFQTIGRALPGRKTIVYTTKPESIIEDPDIETTQEAPGDLIRRLDAAGVNGLAVCGGAQIYSLFAKSGLLDEIYLTVEPVIFGTGIPLFLEEHEYRLELLERSDLNDDVVSLHYRVVKKANPS